MARKKRIQRSEGVLFTARKKRIQRSKRVLFMAREKRIQRSEGVLFMARKKRSQRSESALSHRACDVPFFSFAGAVVCCVTPPILLSACPTQHLFDFLSRMWNPDAITVGMVVGVKCAKFSKGQRIVADLGDKGAMLLRNHGTLACGGTVGECFIKLYYLERACEAQIHALSAGPGALNAPNQGAPEVTAEQGRVGLKIVANALAWPALLRKAYRLDPGFAT